MKVSDKNPLAPVAPAQRPQQASGSPAAPTDKVSSAESERIEKAVTVARQMAGGARAEKLLQLETAIRNGTFKPDPSRIAQQILDEAMLDARVQAMLKG